MFLKDSKILLASALFYEMLGWEAARDLYLGFGASSDSNVAHDHQHNHPQLNHDCNHKEMVIDDLDPWYFPLPSNMCTVTPGSNHDFMNTVYRVVLSSPVMPDLLVDYDMSRKIFSIVQQEDVKNISTGDVEYCSLNDRDANKLLDITVEKETDVENNESRGWKDFSGKYICEGKEVLFHDGVKIPLTILFSRSAYQKGQSLGYFRDMVPMMSEVVLVRLLLGIDQCWLSSCGAAVNMHPQLFRAAILKVPFLDVLNTLLDPNLPLTTLDYEEFGNPQTKCCFDYILKYSPYNNIPRGICCPSMLVSASLNDSRVGVWEAAKWVAKIRDTACSSCSSSVILQTNTSGGHFQEGGRFAHCWETAYEYAFLMKVMGATEKQDMRKDCSSFCLTGLNQIIRYPIFGLCFWLDIFLCSIRFRYDDVVWFL
ncbi:UNVERIFIED_CONTAM: Dipeptidyl aminopeptidase BI [Sesamum calycinum]|uniref:Prolyl endopeptidase n=1 Tax=Sesamum calycinum TaxID=2727403 RepID=A0AAW2SXL5_9LAMI